MDYESLLENRLDKAEAMEVVAYIGNNQKRFDEFMPYFLHEKIMICQRASYVLALTCEQHPKLLDKWMPQVIEQMENPKHSAVVRNIVRTFQYMEPIPEEYEGEIYEKCFEYIADPKHPIAWKAFSMTVCRKIAVKYPELIPELKSVISDAIEYGSSGVKNRGKRELGNLEKINF